MIAADQSEQAGDFSYSFPILQYRGSFRAPPDYPFHGLSAAQCEMVSQVQQQTQELETDEWLDDACVVRYLKASKWDLNDAIARLRKTIAWRHEFKPLQITAEHVYEEAETGKSVLSGFDKLGHPVMYLTPRLENTKTYTRQIQFVVFNMEKAIKY